MHAFSQFSSCSSLLLTSIVTLLCQFLHTPFFGDILPMPYYWTSEEESALKNMVEENRSLREIAEQFHRSPEAIRLKIRRLGLEPPAPQEKTSDKATSKTTTTTRIL